MILKHRCDYDDHLCHRYELVRLSNGYEVCTEHFVEFVENFSNIYSGKLNGTIVYPLNFIKFTEE